MSRTLDSDRKTMDIPQKPNKSIPVEETETSDTTRCLQDRLQTFLKGNLKALGVAQIMIGVKCIFYGIVGSFGINSEEYKIIFFSFYTGFPMWGALSFIISGSLTVVSAKRQTKSLLRGNLGANTLSSLVSIAGLCLLLYSSINIFHYDCKEEYECVGIKSIATGLVIVLLILTCLQILISLPLSMLVYKVDNKNIGWVSVLCFWKSASEGPYQDLLPQTSVYEELEHTEVTPSY